MTKCFIYTDYKPQGEPFYVGKGTSKRVRKKERNSFHDAVCNKYPDWRREIVFEGSADECFIEEKRLIALYGRRNLNTGTLVNLTDGGEGTTGLVVSEETRTKLSEAAKNMSEETRSKISDANKGKTLSDETRAKMSATRKNMSDETRAKMSDSAKGKAKSDEHRAHISEAAKNRSDEHRAKLSAANSRRVVSEETRAKLSVAMKARHAVK